MWGAVEGGIVLDSVQRQGLKFERCDSILNTAVASNLALGVCLHGPHHATASVDATSHLCQKQSCTFTTPQRHHTAMENRKATDQRDLIEKSA